MRVTKAAVIEAASDIADRDGLGGVSLKAVAERLNIRTPSLYNHIGSLDDLLREVAHEGMTAMNDRMTRAAVGTFGGRAIKAVSTEYLNYMIEHPGVYETIQWASWHGNEETERIYGEYIALMRKLIASLACDERSTDEICGLLTGLLHGFTTLQLRYAFEEPERVRREMENAVDTVLLGIGQKYGRREAAE